MSVGSTGNARIDQVRKHLKEIPHLGLTLLLTFRGEMRLLKFQVDILFSYQDMGIFSFRFYNSAALFLDLKCLTLILAFRMLN